MHFDRTQFNIYENSPRKRKKKNDNIAHTMHSDQYFGLMCFQVQCSDKLLREGERTFVESKYLS